jgi:hypothetical protein
LQILTAAYNKDVEKFYIQKRMFEQKEASLKQFAEKLRLRELDYDRTRESVGHKKVINNNNNYDLPPPQQQKIQQLQNKTLPSQQQTSQTITAAATASTNF